MTVRSHFAATVLLLAGTAALLRVAGVRTPDSLAKPLDAFPQTIDGWAAVSRRPLSDHVLDTLKANAYIQRTYQRDRNTAELFVAWYAQQRAGENIHSPRHCLPGGGWEVAETGTVELPSRTGSPVPVNKYIVQNGNDRLLILYWYQSRVRVVANEYAAKLYLARDAVLTGHTAGTIVRVGMRDEPGALDKARQFASGVLSEVQECLGTDR